MTNLANAIKEEIARISRREARASSTKLQTASARYRADIAALKREVAQLKQAIAKLQRLRGGSGPQDVRAVPADTAFRYSAKSMAAQRKRLGLSAAQMGQLLGVSGQSVMRWEGGAARPRNQNFAAIASVRKMGRNEANDLLNR
ncbi:MAG: helix-turn-helix domain-containing protein [Burkholderiaceae bacterium]